MGASRISQELALKKLVEYSETSLLETRELYYSQTQNKAR
jgi:hypothetical protein